MKRYNSTEICKIRELKKEGLSLKDIAAQVGCAETTASYHCRDLFDHPNRVYNSLTEVRRAKNESKKRRYAMGIRSPSDFKKYSHGTHKTYPCVRCSKLIRKKQGICINCYRKELAQKAEIRALQDKEKVKRKIKRETEHFSRLDSKILQDVCIVSGTHYWDIDFRNVGVCRYCKKSKSFDVASSTHGM